MKYMLLIYLTEDAPSEEERTACYEKSAALCRELDASGKFISANPLQPVSTATTLRIREGKRIVTDGPFAETREYLGGYFLVEADDLDEALSIAAKIPGAKFGSVEVRPVIEVSGLPGHSPVLTNSVS